MTPQNPQIYPVYSQSFQEIREKNLLYIDKTDLVYNIIHPEKKFIFLSRPRRFGKSLLVTTLKAYFEGKKDLFKGLKIENLEKEWQEYPVLHFDFCNVNDIVNREDLVRELNERLHIYEDIYGHIEGDIKPGTRLSKLILRAYQQTGKQVVVLIDEYDTPLLDVVNKDIIEDVRGVMKNFYSTLKESTSYLKFVFLTGITKFSQLNFFSALNTIENISMDKKFASICGITEDEMLTQLKPGIENLAKVNGLTYDEAVERLKSQYDGYHFTWPSPDIYNPYSLLNALSKEELGNYWFETATPTFLIETLRKSSMVPEKIGNKYSFSSGFNAPIESLKDTTPILYQSGYLTIKGYDEDNGYLLDFPNKEVKIGLFENLLSYYVSPDEVQKGLVLAKKVFRLLTSGNLNEMFLEIQSYFADIAFVKDNYDEGSFHLMLYFVFSLSGLDVRSEDKKARGIIDLEVITSDTVYIFELKKDKSVDSALKQIEDRGYADGYKYQGLKIVKVGIKIDSKKRNITEWKINL